MRYRFVFDHLVWKFISISAALTHSDEQQHNFIRGSHRRGWVYYVDTKKYSFKVGVILFGFYSTTYKVYIDLPCINTQRLTTSPFETTQVISSRDRQSPRLYEGSADRCEVDRNSNIIRLLQPFQTIHYCNQPVLAIAPDLNVLVWSIKISNIISRSSLVQLFLLHANYLYKTIRLRFYIFGFLPDSRLCDCHCHGWVHYIVTTKNMFLLFVQYRLVFDHLVWKFISIYAALRHRKKKLHHFISDLHSHRWVYYVDTTKIQFYG